MTALLRLFPPKVWLGIGAVALALALFGAYKFQQARADRAEARLAPVVAAAKALDTVATQTPVIRQDQEEKQRAVDEIQGAGDRLPDGFGADLERVRKQRDRNTK